MSNRTCLVLLSSFFLGLGCSSSDDANPAPTDSAVDAPADGTPSDSATDSSSDAPTDSPTDGSADAKTVCESHGGQCIALTATSKCPTGYASSTDSCSGAGSMCCEPLDTDAGGDAATDAADTHD